MKTDLEKLIDRWHAKTGESMPLAIRQLPLDRIRRAVELVESGATVFVPPSHSRVVVREQEEVSSMVQWDRHTEF